MLRIPTLPVLLLAAAPLAFADPASAYEPAPSAAAPASQFTFAWPLGEAALKPRGASTRGTAVTLDPAPSEDWTRLQDPERTPFQHDRDAILAMAGEYRVSFDFLEVLRFDPALKPDAPYQSWGTEVVLVSRDERDVIALQHILVMRVQGEDGTPGEPMVMRHWRQEWRFEPESILAYRGRLRWETTSLDAADRAGAWSQTVYQVDDSPRYSSVGRWQHENGVSTWIGGQTLRPLPRREFSVRKDYHALLGTNRHTITASGWVQEENNLKLVLDEDRTPRDVLPYLAREYGLARYERIKDFDFSAGRTYFERTEPFWEQVRLGWAKLVNKRSVTLKAPVDQGQLFVPFFEHAQKIADGTIRARPIEDQMMVQSVLRRTYVQR
ncbi:DUF6607 family protein [Chiayiivirga flava]|uniref:Uncharacterized protein n=1 Tax=Chiayiivirga flava TaxID=659595 RepID=A0A7W8D5L6_9GAMM|nr:DUF6607 family protein [Chiayiivirga flava]MBB5207225.1 hypothetical protein [Chiayiivirga flava]